MESGVRSFGFERRVVGPAGGALIGRVHRLEGEGMHGALHVGFVAMERRDSYSILREF